MIFFKKIKEVFIPIIPIVLIVVLFNFFVQPIAPNILLNFAFALVLVVVGEVLFLTGVDSTIMPMGEMVGSSVKKVNNIFIFLLFAFLFGMFATVAEPDVQILAEQIVIFGMNINQTLLLFIIGAGVGIFVAFALIRIVRHVPIRLLFLVLIVVTFAIASFVPSSFVAVAFDSGGATVGIVTTPFLLALTSGIVEQKSKNSADNFGVIGIASLGPIIAVLLLSIFLRGDAISPATTSNLNIFVQILYNTTMAIIPLVAVFYLFQIIYIKLPKSKKIALALGIVITFVGLYFFLFGVNFGFIDIGNSLGAILSSKPLYVIILTFALFAFVIVFNEPTIRVLGAQIEAETQGNISRRFVVISIAISMVVAVVLSAVRIYFNISIWYFLGIGYGLIALCMLFSDSLFVSIAFDSGSVAGGPIITAVILPAMVGLASDGAGFGFLAMSTMFPVLTLELIGVAYNIQSQHLARQKKRIYARVAYAAEKYSNMAKLEARYEQIKEKKQNEEKTN